MNKEVFLDSIDEDLLNQQRQTLRNRIDILKAGGDFNKKIVDDFEGLENLLDEISDQLYYQTQEVNKS